MPSTSNDNSHISIDQEKNFSNDSFADSFYNLPISETPSGSKNSSSILQHNHYGKQLSATSGRITIKVRDALIQYKEEEGEKEEGLTNLGCLNNHKLPF